MSKAFTRESDELPEAPVIVRLPSASLPPNAKNYLTPDGCDRLRKELEHSMEVERPRVAALPEAHDSKRQLIALDHESGISNIACKPPSSSTRQWKLWTRCDLAQQSPCANQTAKHPPIAS